MNKLCFDGYSLNKKHFFEKLDGSILPKCPFCFLENPRFKLLQNCPNHFSIFNIFKMRCSEHCGDTMREAQ